jgi:hypothetical protein
MRAFYHHRQSARLYWLAAIVVAVALLAVGFVVGKPLAFAPGVVIVGVVFALFSSLTIEASDQDLSWFFGPGVWRKSVERADIVSVAPVRNPWWYGWGVHLTPRGWLYNVAGLDAVEISLSDGRTFRLGTDEPQALARALVPHATLKGGA